MITTVGDRQLVSPLRLLYFKAGEIITLLAIGIFAFFIVKSFWGAEILLENETRSRQIIMEIYRQETKFLRDSGYFTGLEELIERSDRLGDLELIPARKVKALFLDSDCELATDGQYIYLLNLVHALQNKPDLTAETEIGRPVGFKVLCWPTHFTITGEVCYYLDDSGAAVVTSNMLGTFDGFKNLEDIQSLFPDLSRPAGKKQSKSSRKSEKWVPLDGLTTESPSSSER